MDIVLLVARIFISVVFLFSGIHKSLYFEAGQQEFRAAKIPLPDVCLVMVIALHLIASICLIIGFCAQLSALALAAFTVVVTLWVHDFWNRSGEQRLNGARDATANLAIIGGLLMVCLLYTSPSPRDQRGSRMPSSA